MTELGEPRSPFPRWEGEVHPAYDSARPEIVGLVPLEARRVLDVGCASGAATRALRSRGAEVVGVESDPELAAIARTALDRVVEGNIEQFAASGDRLGADWDCIVFADVLEHLRDPWSVVRWADTALARGGSVVVSVPNVRHAKTLWSLIVRAHWPYEEVGIFDRTHLRFFARRNLPELFVGTGLTITEVRRNPMLRLDMRSRWNALAPWLGDFGTLQFLVRAEKRALAR